MTAPFRLLLFTLALLGVAPAAQAATSSAWNAGTVTLTNDADGETFAVNIDVSANPATYTVTATNGTIGAPPQPGSNCTLSNGNKTLSCTVAPVSQMVILGGDGNDTFTIAGDNTYGSSPGLTIEGQNGNDTFTAVGDRSRLGDRIRGGPDDDTFNGSNDNTDYFYAEAGNDTYRGGTDAVDAGLDPETFQALYRTDWYYATSNQFIRRRRADVPVNLSLDGQPNDVDGKGGTDNLADDIERLNGTDAGDTLTGGSHSVYLDGRGGDDTLAGSPAPDELYGGRGADALRAGGGADVLYDGDYDVAYLQPNQPPIETGDDTLEGGDGDDILVYNAGKDDVRGGGGTDTAYFTRVETQIIEPGPDPAPPIKWRPISLTLDDVANDGAEGEGDNLHADVENIDTTATDYGSLDRRSASLRRTRLEYQDQYTSRSEDTIVGTDAPNVFVTGRGNDSVEARGGADIIEAGGGDDQVNAVDRVTDLIRCGAGNDNVGADLPGTNPGRADALSDCENVSGTPLGLEGGVLPTLPEVPELTLGGTSSVKSKTFLKKWTVGVGVTSDQTITATGELTTTQATIAKVGALSIGSGRLAAGEGARTLKLKVAKKYRKKLKRKLRTKKQRRKGIRLAAVVTVTNASGQTATARRTIKIKG